MIAGLPPFYDRNRQTMYRKILEAEIEPPAFMSPDALDLCQKMLIRDPTRRLGYDGADALKAHPFFKSIDWDALERRAVRPPWVPNVTSSTDTSNISSEFTSEPAGVTPSPAGSRLRDALGTEEAPPSFRDFTFTQESALDARGRDSFDDERLGK